MATKFWLKLHYEILDDAKMGFMDDHTWRRCIEFFLIAGENNKNGLLPSIKKMAWRLRTSEQDLYDQLKELETLGIITVTEDEYIVTNYVKRQARISDVERQTKQREEKKDDENSHDTVTARDGMCHDTVTARDTDIDIDIDKDKDKDSAFDFLMHAFQVKSKLLVFNPNYGIKAINEMVQAHCIPEDIEWAVDEASRQDVAIKGPWNVKRFAVQRAAERLRGATDKQPIYAEEY